MKRRKHLLAYLVVVVTVMLPTSCITEGPGGGPTLVKQWEMTNYDEMYPMHPEQLSGEAWEFTEFGRLLIFEKVDGKWMLDSKFSGVNITKTDDTSGTITVPDWFLSPFEYNSLTFDSVIIVGRDGDSEYEFHFKATSDIVVRE